jgi:plastocyanin
MRRIGKVAVILGITACLGIALVACGGDDDENTAGGTTPPAGSTTAAPTKAAGTTPAAVPTTAAPTKAAATTPTAASTAAAPTAADSSGTEALSVAAKDFSFALDKGSVKKGSQVDVAFENQGSAPHTINFYTDEAYTKPIADAESGSVSGGGSKAFTFTAPADGTAAYYRCEVHPTQMTGELALD